MDVEFLDGNPDASCEDEDAERRRRPWVVRGIAVLVAAAAAATVVLGARDAPPHPRSAAPHTRSAAPHRTPAWIADLTVKAAIPLEPGYQVVNGVGCPQADAAGLDRRFAAVTAAALPGSRVLQLRPALDRMAGLCGLESRVLVPGAVVVVEVQAVRDDLQVLSVRTGRIAARVVRNLYQPGEPWSVDIAAVGRPVPTVAALTKLAATVDAALAVPQRGRRHAP